MSKGKTTAIAPELYDLIRSPVITEKATKLSEHSKVVFRVPLDASKPAVKTAVEALFKVKVKSVNTIVTKGKTKRLRDGRTTAKNDVKKAIVTLEPGHAIDVTTGL